MDEQNLFTNFSLSAPLNKALDDLKYLEPTAIQLQAIPPLLEGENLLGTAQTGTGKTAAFALPLLNRLDTAKGTPQILVLTPTRELALQVHMAFAGFAKYLKGYRSLAVYGGSGMGDQLKNLKRGVQVIIGTPGRLLDHLRRGSLRLDSLQALVLDEADEMLRMGFIDDVETIMAAAPENCQKALFSATMPQVIRKVAGKYLGDARQVHVKTRTATVERIEQQYIFVRENQKREALVRLLEAESCTSVIVFVRTKAATMEIAESLIHSGFKAAPLNGDLSQQLRERTIANLKSGRVTVLVATDVAARGLDVEGISHVLNYDIPFDTEAYIHRIGRTGRAGKEGKAILFVTPREKRLLQNIERVTRQRISEIRLPGSKEISRKRIEKFQESLKETLLTEDLDDIRTLIEEMVAQENIDIVDVAAALACQVQKESPLFPVFKDQNPKKERFSQKDSRGREDNSPMITFRLAVGKKHNVSPGDIVGALANEADIQPHRIGRIDLFETYCTVDLPKGLSDKALKQLQRVRIRQRPAQAQPVNGANRSPGKKTFKEKDRQRGNRFRRS